MAKANKGMSKKNKKQFKMAAGDTKIKPKKKGKKKY